MRMTDRTKLLFAGGFSAITTCIKAAFAFSSETALSFGVSS